MKLRPLQDRILVQRIKEEGKRIALEVKKSDRILFCKFSGTEVKIEGEEYLIMREDDALGVVE